ncbi:hypothetical protein C8R44DRAFT_585422, partial [Mycena epipterygia]
EWNGWPDGNFKALFSIAFAEQTDNLAVHWACQPLGGRGGTAQAENWQDGKPTRRKCLGSIECESDACNIVVRPQTRVAGIQKQLDKPCACGAQLAHHPCDVVSTLHTFKSGIYYQNGGSHNHSRPTLVVGRPGVNGPGDSVAVISPLLVNAERVKYERRKVLKGPGGHGGDNFLKEFAKFEASNPGFIRTSQLGLVSIIVLQTSFMAARLAKSISIDAEAVSGIVSDAAHGFWKERNSLLIVSSTYEPVHLDCWVPGLISYSNGGTAEHYRIHFFELFQSIAEEYDVHDIELTDDAFANVVDFSSAERSGFILAFIDFWCHRAPGERSIEELQQTAPKLLKGCSQHFRNQITRVKKISGVVDP